MTKLKKLLKYVSEHNDFYKKIIRDCGIIDPTDITQYPILDRQVLQENRYNMFSDGYKTKYYSQLLKRNFSSGTSGFPISVYWGADDYSRSMMSLWRKRLQYYGVKPSDKVIKFTLSVYNVDFREFTDKNIFSHMEAKNVLIINRSCLQHQKQYEELIKLIDQFSPTWIYIQPFVLNNLLYYYKIYQKKLPLSIKYIESVGEALSPKLKKDAIEYFAVPIANMYGSEEMNGIAYECRENEMHILEDNVFVELKTSKSVKPYGEGEALITNLNNRAMPLIRYNQADIIKVSDESATCLCGNHSPIIEIIKGRVRESIYRRDININTYLLIEVIDEVNNSLKDIILQFQFTYSTKEDTMKCFLKLTDEELSWKTTVEDSIKLGFEKRGICDLKLIFVYSESSIYRENNSKNIIFTIQR